MFHKSAHPPTQKAAARVGAALSHIVPGTPAGALHADPSGIAPVITVMAYDSQRLLEVTVTQMAELAALRTEYPQVWVNVEGLGDVATLHALGLYFGLHALTLEDVLSRQQRAKRECFDNYQFIVLLMLWWQAGVQAEQLSLFWGADFVLSLQAGHPGDSLVHVRRQLRDPQSRLRQQGADYLLYALLDSVLDHYFPVLEALGDRLDAIEVEISSGKPHIAVLHKLHRCKRELRVLRRAVWPLRELFHGLMREPVPTLRADTQLYLRDCYDHVVLLLDVSEAYRELSADLGEFYLSRVNHRMNAIIKVMTIVTTIFVPLTFIAGIYGMNFHAEQSPWNMPELNAYWGYPSVLLLMLLVALGLLGWFWWRGWLGNEERLEDEARD